MRASKLYGFLVWHVAFCWRDRKRKRREPDAPAQRHREAPGTQIRQAAPVWGVGLPAVSRSLKNSRFPVRPSDYAKFVRTRRFKTRTAISSTTNSQCDRLRMVERHDGRQGQRQPRWRCLPKWPVPGRAWGVGAVFTPRRPLPRRASPFAQGHGAVLGLVGPDGPRPACIHPLSNPGKMSATASVTRWPACVRQQGRQGDLMR
jgi:hypothetical protein